MNRGPNLATDRSRLLPGGNSARSRQVRYLVLGTKSPCGIRGKVWSVLPGISSLCFDADQRKRYAVWIKMNLLGVLFSSCRVIVQHEALVLNDFSSLQDFEARLLDFQR